MYLVQENLTPSSVVIPESNFTDAESSKNGAGMSPVLMTPHYSIQSEVGTVGQWATLYSVSQSPESPYTEDLKPPY